jgi:hypothetical protein
MPSIWEPTFRATPLCMTALYLARPQLPNEPGLSIVNFSMARRSERICC